MIHVGTSITKNYVTRARRFLDSLNRTPVGDRFCVTFGFEKSTLARRYSRVRFSLLPETNIVHSFGVIQWGAWLDATPWINSNDLCVFSDADVVIQRTWTDAELERFFDYDDQTIGMGSNKSRDDTLGDEAHRIGFVDSEREYGDWVRLPCRHAGVLIARAKVFRRLRDEYEIASVRFHAINHHESRPQWLINWIIQTKLHLTVDLLGPEIISLGHFGIPKDCIRGYDGVLRVEDTAVMFAHRIGGWIQSGQRFAYTMGQVR